MQKVGSANSREKIGEKDSGGHSPPRQKPLDLLDISLGRKADDGTRTHGLLHGNEPKRAETHEIAAWLSQIALTVVSLSEAESGCSGRKLGRKFVSG